MSVKTNPSVNRPLYHAILLVALIFLSGCTGTRYLKEGETFYSGADIRIDTQGKNIGRQKAIKTDLQTLITPEPNGKFLGMRPGVWFYYIAGTPKKKKGFRNFLKTKMGAVPVLLSDATPDKTAQALQGQLNNEGYFKSKVAFEVETKGKKSEVIYNVKLEPPYRLGKITYPFLDSLHEPLSKAVQKESLLRERQRYRLQRLNGELQRIEDLAKNFGFYYFDDRYLVFTADSTVGKYTVDVELTTEGNVPEKMTRIYIVDEIKVLPSYTLQNDSLKVNSDTVRVDGYTYIDNHHNFRPTVITNVINLRPDSIYRRINHEYSLSHLMGLNTFKFVNIKFEDSPRDSSTLNASIFLTPLLKKSIRIQMQGVSKSNNFVGPGMEFTFTNRNFLRGAELFQLKLSGAYEMQISGKQANPLNAIEFVSEASLSVPRFITPFHIPYRSAKYLPKTQAKISYSFQQRMQYFRLASSNISTGYLWRETTLKTHELFPVDLTYVHLSNTSDAFNDLLEKNTALGNSFQNQFILGSRYSFTLNTQLSDDIEQKYMRRTVKKYHFYFNGTIDFSGNALYAIQQTNRSKEQPYTFLGSPYSQYTRGHVDFRYYYQLSRKSKLAARVAAGVGYAYGNSSQMPYIKQFSMGGSNSVRAFPARSLGPGTYNVRNNNTDSVFFIDQRGDIKMEGSIEYRFDIIKSLKGAVFADAGNIWLLRKDSLRAGGEFDRKRFMKEFAVGTGFGLRYDFSFFVLRFDLAFPLRKPFLDENNRWVMDQINFGSSAWRRENLILNIAIGYPF